MAQLAEDGNLVLAESRTSNPVLVTSLIRAHGLERIYGRSFLVRIPAIYVALGLAPIQAGLLDAVRRPSSGTTSMSGGFFVDLFQHRRAQVLSFSMTLIGIGCFLYRRGDRGNPGLAAGILLRRRAVLRRIPGIIDVAPNRHSADQRGLMAATADA